MPVSKFNKVWLQRNCWFAYLAVMLCWGINSLCNMVNHYMQGIQFVHYENGTLIISDFVLWYSSALLAAKASLGPVDIYEPTVQFNSLQEVIRPHVLDMVQYVQYPPHFFALIKPFAYLSLGHAWIAWCLLALPLISLALWQLAKNIAHAPFSKAFYMVVGLTSFPTWYAFELGQTTLFQYPALVAYWLLLRADKFYLAGLVSALLTVKLQYAPCVILVGLILGRLKFFLGLLTSATILFVYTVTTVGLNNLIVYPKSLLYAETSEKVGGIAAEVMQNFRGEMLLFHLDVHLVHLIASALFAVGVLFVVMMWLFAYPRLSNNIGRKAFDICVSVTTFIMLICSPHTHFQDYMAVSIPIAFLYPILRSLKPEELKLSILRFLLWGFPLYSWLTIVFMVPLVMCKIQPYFVWAILVLLVGASIGLDNKTSFKTNKLPNKMH